MGPRRIMRALLLFMVILRDCKEEADNPFYSRGSEKKTYPAFGRGMGNLRPH